MTDESPSPNPTLGRFEIRWQGKVYVIDDAALSVRLLCKEITPEESNWATVDHTEVVTWTITADKKKIKKVQL